ncbi:M48 family metalloprotease [Streptomyces syringium]|uniref:M48 family metalloprotease n=1 Tax=Streptomyces syringium TaxID=76729 RepID=UPI0034041B95
MRRYLEVGTTLRFCLLLVLIAVSGLDRLRDITAFDRDRSIEKDASCQLASGIVSPSIGSAARELYVRCMEGREAALYPTWQQALWALLGVAGVALIIYVSLPTWKRHHRRLIPLHVPLDRRNASSALLAELSDLRARTALPAERVSFVLDPYDNTCSAVTFGRFGRNTVVLNGGLLKRMGAGLARERALDSAGEPDAELETHRGVVLHELNHVANRDVGLTYATIAAWRAFLLAALGPAIALALAPAFGSTSDALGTGLSSAQFLTSAAGLVAAVYLARVDILRVREYHADALPPEWHGTVRGRLVPADDTARSWHERLSQARRRLWHPSNSARHRALDNPAKLFRTNLTPIGLAGFVTALIANQSAGLAQLSIAAPTLWLTAALALSVLAVPIWRAATYAADHDTSYPRGWREGAALGSGLVSGYWIAFPDVSGAWLPHSPWLLAIVFAGSVMASVWMAQLASFCARLLPPHLRTPGFWAGQVATIPAFGAPLVFFLYSGTTELSGGNSLGLLFNGVVADGQWLPLPRAAAFLSASTTWLAGDVAAVVGATLMWLLPTLLILSALLRPQWPLRPRLRSVFWPTMGGAAGALAVVLVTNGLWHHDLLRPGADGADWWLYQAWLEVGLVAASAAAAAATTALLPSPTVPYAVVAGGITLLLGVVSTAALWLTDGCLGPFNVRSTICLGRTDVFSSTGPGTLGHLSRILVIGLFTLVAAAVAASAVRSMGCYLVQRYGRPQARRAPLTRAPVPARRSAICLAVVATAMVALIVPAGAAGIGAPAKGPPRTTESTIRTLAWLHAGGSEIYQKLNNEMLLINMRALDVARLPRVTDETTAGELVGTYRAFGQARRSGAEACRRLQREAIRAQDFMPIPDPAAHSAWQDLYTAARNYGTRCARDLSTGRMSIVEAALKLPSVRLKESLNARLPAEFNALLIARLKELGAV